MRVIIKCPTFASAFGNESGDVLTFWQKRCKNPVIFLLFGIRFHTISALEKEKRKKLPVLFGGYMKKFLPLHPLSEKNESLKRSDL